MPKLLESNEWISNSIFVEMNTQQQSKMENEKTLESSIRSIDRLTKSFCHITLNRCETLVPVIISTPSIGVMISKNYDLQPINDFINSDVFYRYLKNKKIKIIDDQFSFDKNHMLYRAFYLLESKLRIAALSNGSIVKHIPINSRSKSIDHKVSNFQLSELFESYLMQPASEAYVKQVWTEKQSDPQRLIGLSRQLTNLDELNFCLSKENLKFLQNIRNQCMHFRVTTLSDYLETVSYVNEYIIDRNNRYVLSNPEVIRRFQENILKIRDENSGAINKLLGIKE